MPAEGRIIVDKRITHIGARKKHQKALASETSEGY
jgi:hypothetical protein